MMMRWTKRRIWETMPRWRNATAAKMDTRAVKKAAKRRKRLRVEISWPLEVWTSPGSTIYLWSVSWLKRSSRSRLETSWHSWRLRETKFLG